MASGSQFKGEYSEKIWTPIGVLSWPSVFETRLNEQSGKQSFSCQLMIPKDQDIKPLAAELSRLSVLSFGESMKDIKRHRNVPIKDGDEKEGDNRPEHGHWLIRAGSNEDKPPAVIGPRGEPITAKREIYAGAIGRMQVVIGTYFAGGTKGVTMFLRCVQKLGDGQPLSGDSGFDPSKDIPPPVEIPASLRNRIVDRPPPAKVELYTQSDADRAMAGYLNGGSIDNDDDLPF
jgi:hypothetical protein